MPKIKFNPVEYLKKENDSSEQTEGDVESDNNEILPSKTKNPIGKKSVTYVHTLISDDGRIEGYQYNIPAKTMYFHVKFRESMEYLNRVVGPSKIEFLRKAIINEVRRRLIRERYEKIAVIEALKEEIRREIVDDLEETNEIWLPRHKKTENDKAREKFIMKLREIDERKRKALEKKTREENRIKDIAIIKENEEKLKATMNNPLEPIVPILEDKEEIDSIVEEVKELKDNQDKVEGESQNSEEDTSAAPTIEDLYK